MEQTLEETKVEERRKPKDRRTGEWDEYWLHWNPERRKGERRRSDRKDETK